MKYINNFLFRQIDNTALIVFRVFFGALLFLESVGAIFTGWVKRTFMDPEFTFSFIGFEWLQPLPGNGMYYYFAVMGVFGFMVMLGYKYRLAMFSFAIMWAGVFFMQKSSYNNHYYLLMVLNFIMILVPANRFYSVDVKLNSKLKTRKMYNWQKWLVVGLMAITYIFGAINKFYGDWLRAIPVQLFLTGKQDYFLIGDILQERWVHYVLSYMGIIFDGFIVFALLYKPTRKIAFACAIFFHLFNSIVFQIGIFPYLSLAFCLFFFEPKILNTIFFKKNEIYQENEILVPKKALLIKWFFFVFFAIQLLLPLRHFFIQDDVLWTEEGHRLSWRMMLRTKSGRIDFKVIEKGTKISKIIDYRKRLSSKQSTKITTKPDFIWQFVQRLKKEYKDKGIEIEVYAINSEISVNGKEYKPFINPEIDLASVKWSFFTHSNWLLHSPKYTQILE